MTATHWTERLDGAFSDLFGKQVRALWVTTGTAANCLGLAALCPPHGAILCHETAHIEVDEAGAPGFFTHGAKLILLPGHGAKVTPETVEEALRPRPRRRPPGPARRAVDHQRHRIWPELLARRGRRAGRGRQAAHGLGFHLDGARFANAVAFTGADPADLTWRAGVDVMSFGFVKNGGMNAEALIFFDPAKAEDVPRLRKRAGHLLSKGRYLAAQILAMLEDDLWLANARAANAAAAALAEAAGASGWSIRSRPMSCSCG